MTLLMIIGLLPSSAKPKLGNIKEAFRLSTWWSACPAIQLDLRKRVVCDSKELMVLFTTFYLKHLFHHSLSSQLFNATFLHFVTSVKDSFLIFCPKSPPP